MANVAQILLHLCLNMLKILSDICYVAQMFSSLATLSIDNLIIQFNPFVFMLCMQGSYRTWKTRESLENEQFLGNLGKVWNSQGTFINICPLRGNVMDKVDLHIIFINSCMLSTKWLFHVISINPDSAFIDITWNNHSAFMTLLNSATIICTYLIY